MTDQTPTANTAPHPGVAVQYAIHAALRRDLGRLVDALSTDQADDTAITAYAEEFLFQLHHHHTFEDDEIWPLMGQRLGDSAAELLDRNLAEHGDIVVAVQDFTASIDGLDEDRSRAHAAVTRLREAISTHLAHEEADVIPLIPQAFTLEDVGRFQGMAAEQNPPNRFLPWALESAPEPIASGFHGVLPPPVQELLATAWMPVWQATVDAMVSPAQEPSTVSASSAAG